MRETTRKMSFFISQVRPAGAVPTLGTSSRPIDVRAVGRRVACFESTTCNTGSASRAYAAPANLGRSSFARRAMRREPPDMCVRLFCAPSRSLPRPIARTELTLVAWHSLSAVSRRSRAWRRRTFHETWRRCGRSSPRRACCPETQVSVRCPACPAMRNPICAVRPPRSPPSPPPPPPPSHAQLLACAVTAAAAAATFATRKLPSVC